MQSFESTALINARSSTVWDIITDAGNLTVWESGITWIDGELRNGGTIRIKALWGKERPIRVRVQQLPGQVMTWKAGTPLGLLTRTRTFILTPQEGLTRFRVTDEFRGPLVRLADGTVPDAGQGLNDYVDAVKKRAELLDRTI